jgi:opacity protein-like surface antigen
MLRTFVTLCAAALLSAEGLRAQLGTTASEFSARRVQVGLGGGVVVPRNNPNAQEVLKGASGQAFVLLQIAPGFPPLRFGADFSRMKFGEVQRGASGGSVGSTRTQLGGIASMRFDLLPGPVRPYVLAGVGAFNIREAIAAAALGGSVETLTSTKVGLDGGAGLSFRMGRISGFLESRFQNVYTRDAGLINPKSIQSIPVTFGIVF